MSIKLEKLEKYTILAGKPECKGTFRRKRRWEVNIKKDPADIVHETVKLNSCNS